MTVLASPLAATPTYELGWDGVPLHASPTAPMGMDTETTVCTDPARVADLVLVSASDGRRCVVLPPEQLVDFLQAHPSAHFVWHNFAYDFWVIEKYLRDKNPGYLPHWFALVDENRQHDTQYLDMLVRLGEGRGEGGEDSPRFFPRNLGEVAREWAGVTLDKTDPYRMRYGELLGVPFSHWKAHPEPGFWEYAAKDAYGVWAAFRPLARRAREIQRRFARALPGGETTWAHRWAEWGLLTEQIQVRGALALEKIERNGLPFDPKRAADDRLKWLDKLTDLITEMDGKYPGLFKRDKNGKYIRAKKSGAPSINQHALEEYLSQVADAVRVHVPDFYPPQAQGKTADLISKSQDDWAPYAPYSEFLKSWSELEKCSKRLEFHALFDPKPRTLFDPAGDCRIRPRYQVLMRTGRTSSSNPNTQNLPRDKEFRGIFTAAFGHKLVTADYSFIELRTLAATVELFQGESTLARVIREGKVDPHVYTAALARGMTLADFQALKKTDPNAYADGRRAAKAINFGVPGGLGADKLVWYAQATYGVTWTRAEAEAMRLKLIREIYPELNDRDGYLSDRFTRLVSMNTGLTVREVEDLLCRTVLANRDGSPGRLESMPPWMSRVIGKVAGGRTTKYNDEPYDPEFLARVRAFLQGLAERAPADGPLTPQARAKLQSQMPRETVRSELTFGHGITLTGRVRANVTFTKEKNTPFQGLAADGAKLALWELVKQEQNHPGFLVVAFVHDEIVCEVPVTRFGEKVWAGSIERVMNEQMERVLYGVPCATESHTGDHWEK